MEQIYGLLLERNRKETIPFQSVYTSNSSLVRLNQKLQTQCSAIETDISLQTNELIKLKAEYDSRGPTKTEIKQREKIDQLQDRLNEKSRNEAEVAAVSLETASKLSKETDKNKGLELTVTNLKEEVEKQEEIIDRLNKDLKEAWSQTSLAEKQYDGLKETIRRLQNENEELTKSNEEFVNRIVQEKEKSVEEMNSMIQLNEEMKKKIDMLSAVQKQEKKKFLWSAIGVQSKQRKGPAVEEKNTRKFGAHGVIVPSAPKTSVRAHQTSITCMRYDSSGMTDILATAGEDSTVKIWQTGNGQRLKSFKGNSGHVVIGVDVYKDLAAAASSDKTCRVWNIRTERMIHQLVGHSHKITDVKLLNSGKAILTASADRSMKVWDITRSTYRQTETMRHSSPVTSVDVSHDSYTTVSGHLDGGLRFWDCRTSERTGDITDLHSNGVTCVRFNPAKDSEILTVGRDNVVRLIDSRKTSEEIQNFHHADFRVDTNYALCAISPDGKYASAGSSSTGDIFIWRTIDGHLQNQLKGHETGVSGVAWGMGGSNGQQFASMDKGGFLVLWA